MSGYNRLEFLKTGTIIRSRALGKMVPIPDYLNAKPWLAPYSHNIMIEFDGRKTIAWEGLRCNTCNQFKAARSCASRGIRSTTICNTSPYELFGPQRQTHQISRP